MKRVSGLLLVLFLSLSSGAALADVSGLNAKAMDELRAAGVDKYLGTSQSVASDYGVWTRHDFDPNYVLDPTYPAGARPDGPVCIAGTPYSVFTRKGDPKKLLIFMQGGGACWQNFSFCNILAEDQQDLSNGFAREGEKPFDGIAYDSGLGGAPIFDGCVAHFQCETWAKYDGGDHIIIVGKVVDFNSWEREPLVFGGGAYRSLK